MAASNEWTEWHLTPDGWIRGSQRTDFQKVLEAPPPNRVKTCQYKELISSPTSELKTSLDTVWESENSGEVERLASLFGQCPNQL